MKEYTIFLPTKYNNGTAVAESTFESIKQRAIDDFGGATFDSNAKQGFWRSDAGELFKDENVAITVSAIEGSENVSSFVLWLKELLEQEAMYVSIADVVFM